MKRILAVLVIILLGSSGMAWGSNAWGLYGAYWNTADADDAFGAGLKVSVEMIEGIQLELRGTYVETLTAADLDLDVFPLEAGLAVTHAASERVDLYGGGGLGYYFMGGDGNPDDEVGFYFTTGAEMVVSDSGASYGKTESVLFTELMYRFVDAHDASLDGLGVNAGLLIRW